MAGGFPRPEVHQGIEFRKYVEYGITPIEAIRTATVTAADLLGWSDRIGSNEPGKFPDIVAVAGNPLADTGELERVKFVMKDGRNGVSKRVEVVTG
ncbi:MAG TPA: amidohydrolase family protein [Candidatus Acidoferrales bacterium]|nr:amidohydrolase family protein [Candidatus Acidoferrales bacterium]